LKDISVARILSGGPFPRSVNILVPIGIESRISGMIDQCAVCYAIPALEKNI